MSSTIPNLTNILTVSAGTGPLVLGNAVPMFRGQDALVDGATYSYCIQQSPADFEFGTGVWAASTHTLTRSVIKSSAANAAIPVQLGAQVAFTALAEDIQASATAALSLSSDRTIITLGADGTPNPSVQTTVFTAAHPNIAEAPTWAIADATGAILTPTSNYLTIAGSKATLTLAHALAAAGSTAGVIVTASIVHAERTYTESAVVSLVSFPSTWAGGTLDGDRVTIPHRISIGNAPAGTIYKIGAGDQSTLPTSIFQRASLPGWVNAPGEIGNPPNVIDIQFGDDRKPITWQTFKSRGNGRLGDPECYKKTLAGDALFIWGFYGSADADGVVNTATGGHAGYVTVTQEHDTPDPTPGDLDSMLAISSGVVGRKGQPDQYPGTGGVQFNCKAQTSFSGPNRANYPIGTTYRAVLEIGPGTGVGEQLQALAFSDAPLVDPTASPSRISAGGVEYFNGQLYFTHSFVSGVLNRRQFVTAYIPTFTTLTQPAGTTVTARYAQGMVEFTVVVGGADVANGTVARQNISPALPAVPLVQGSFGTVATLGETLPVFSFTGTTGAIIVNLIGGALLAGRTYVITVSYRLP